MKNKKIYNESYIKKWLYFDNMKNSMKQAEIDTHEIQVENLEENPIASISFDEQLDNYVNNNVTVSFGEIIENEKLFIAYRKLSDREKLVIEMYYQRGFTQYEIADIIGIQQASVAKILIRATKKLFELMNGEQF